IIIIISIDHVTCVSDLNEAIPETELLDNSIQKGRAQLSVKSRRHRPSRSRYRDSVSSTEGDDMLVSDTSRDTSPADPGSPTVVFDKKTKRRFLDLGRTDSLSAAGSCPSPSFTNVSSRVLVLTVSSVSSVPREPSESPSRSSGSFVPFSWFTEGRGSLSSSGTPPCSPKIPPLGSPRPRKSHSQVQTPPPCVSDLSFLSEGQLTSHHQTAANQRAGFSTLTNTDLACFVVGSTISAQVCQWLRGLNMEQYVPEFSARDVDGQQLLQMDGNKLKSLGVLSSSDRNALKRRIKDIHSAAEKEKKALDKLEKQKEKQRRKDQEQRRN
uniref:Sterile alpha motif domain containing 14 n=1 Tax=Seriola lalandi dorsalis TaxID=1841481 RepID=A0A3B4WJI3_SERLL